MTHDESPAPATVAQVPPASAERIGGLPINDTSSSSVNPSNEPTPATVLNDKGKGREKITTSTGNSAGHSVPGSPINK